MADLNELNSALATKIAGAASTGAESNFVNATANGDLNVTDLVNNGGVSNVIAVSSSAIAIRVGGANLTNRKRLTFMNTGSVTMYWSYDPALTGAANGCPIFRHQTVSDIWGPNTTIYIISPLGAGSLFVAEGA